MEKNDLHIRLATVADLMWCSQHDQYADQHIIAEKIDRQELLIATLAENRVGFFRFEYLWSKLPFIAMIFVDPKMRKCGIASELLKYFEQVLLQKSRQQQIQSQIQPQILSSIMPNNLVAQQWHLRHGFQKCGTLQGVNVGNIDEIFYLKKLTD